ncbi:MAG: flagellar hook-associated protein FlgK [Pseudomonadota bacterium]
MTLSSALSNAMTGLRSAGRTSEVISSNIANALTPGYGVRSLSVSSSEIGGVFINGVVRDVDPSLLADVRLAEATFANNTERTGFLTQFEDLLGTPDEPNSLAMRLSEFENSLVTAASRPDAPERLLNVADAARDLTTLIKNASDGVQEARTNADRDIQIQIDQLSNSLQNVKELNSQISRTLATGGDTSALLDSRQSVVDEISAIVPIRQVSRDNGQIALYSTGGAILLDGSVAEIEFAGVNQVTPYMTIEGGQLSGLSVNGYPVRTDSERGALGGGSLGALFEIRDELGTQAQSQLDAFARDLVERFQDPAVDTTLLPGDAGLFTDEGLAFTPANETGLSSRLELNAAVDERQGGDPWRIRDGINALAPGDVGDARQLLSLTDALTEKRTPASGNFGVGALSASNLLSALTSQAGSERFQAEKNLSFASSQFDELTQQMLADGVDTDEELQRLLLIERAYAANVRMIEAADEMMQTILRI